MVGVSSATRVAIRLSTGLAPRLIRFSDSVFWLRKCSCRPDLCYCPTPNLTGYGKTRWARRTFIGLYVLNNRSAPRRMLKKARRLTRPTPARRDAPFRGQGRSSAADPRFTFHASRFTAAGSEARTPLADFFSILLDSQVQPAMLVPRITTLPDFSCDWFHA